MKFCEAVRPTSHFMYVNDFFLVVQDVIVRKYTCYDRMLCFVHIVSPDLGR